MASSSTKMLFMHDILCRNEQAVMLMRSSRYDEAALVLRGAFQQLSSHLSNAQDNALDESEDSSNDSSGISVTHVEVMDSLMQARKQQHHNHNDAFYIYTQAFLFYPTSSSCSKSSPSSQNQQETSTALNLSSSAQAQVLAILLYNGALAMHIGSMTGIPCHKKVLSALRMYDMALRILPSENFSSSCDYLLPLKLAVVNNKGHICSDFFEQSALDQCLCSMEDLLKNFDEEHCPDQSERDVFHQFYLNLLIFASDSNARSAPAA